MGTAAQIHGSNPALSATNWVSVLSRVFDFSALQILPLVQGLCANRAMTVFTQRRIRAAFAAIAARASRVRILVVRRSLPGKPNSRGRARRIMRDTRRMVGSCTERQWADANPKRCRCSFHSSGSRVSSMRRRAVSSGGCLPLRIALTISGARSVRRKSRVA